ncbi:MAG: hypothetical protein ACOYNZ_08450 [Rhodoferax sp.]
MTFTTAMVAVFLPIACIATAVALMRLFDVKAATAEQSQVEAEKLLAQVNQEVTVRRRVRAGAPSNATVNNLPRLACLSETRMRFPSTQLEHCPIPGTGTH